MFSIISKSVAPRLDRFENIWYFEFPYKKFDLKYDFLSLFRRYSILRKKNKNSKKSKKVLNCNSLKNLT